MTLAPKEEYHKNLPSQGVSQPERRGVSRKPVIDKAKEKVLVIELADRLVADRRGAGDGGNWRKVGDKWVTLCLLPGHEERTPSFTVYADNDRGFWCYGCGRGGDVVDLAAAAWGYGEGEMAMAAAQLLKEFGHRIPPRPESWFAKQERQRPIRDALNAAEVGHAQRRVFRRFVPLIRQIEDEDERQEEIELLWDAAHEIAVLVVAAKRKAS